MVHRQDFIDRLTQKGYSKERAATILDDCIGVVEEALINGEAVSFHGFGTFEIRDRITRKAVNLQKKDVQIPAYKTVHFKLGKALKREIKTGILER